MFLYRSVFYELSYKKMFLKTGIMLYLRVIKKLIMKKTITILFFMMFYAVNSQTLLQESFETSLNWTAARVSGSSANVGWRSAAAATFSRGGGSPYAGDKMAVFNSYSIPSGNTYSLTSPAIAFAGASYQVKFRVYQNGTDSATDQISLFYNTTTSLTGATILGSVRRVLNDVDQANGWYTYVYDIPGTPNGNGYVTFLASSNNGFDIAIDDVSIQVKNSCAFPLTDGVSNVTTTGALVSFENVGTSYDYVLDTTYTDPTAGAVLSTTPNFFVDLTNLTPSTTYYFHVRNSCGTTSKSDWKTIVFRTATPPNNDLCANAITLVPSSRFDADFTTGTTINSNRTLALPNSVCSSSFNDVWYRAVVPASGSLTFETKPVSGSLLTDTSLIVYSGSCSSLSTINCNMDFSADKFSKVTISGRTPGEIVYVAVFAVAGSGEFQIEAYDASLVPLNNNCGTPQALICGTSFTSNQVTANLRGTIISTPNTAFPACRTSSTTGNLWYTVVVPNSGNLSIAKVLSGASSSAILSAYSGNGCGNLVEIGCTTTDLLKLTGRTPGEKITFSLWNNSFDGRTSTYTISAFSTPIAPLNDLCSGATTLNVGTTFSSNVITGTNAGTVTSTTNTVCGGTRYDDVWYSVVVPASGKLTIETDAVSSSLFRDSYLQVFSGTCDNLTSIACNDDDGNGTFSKIALVGRTPGERLYIAVYNYVDNEVFNDSFTISAYDVPVLLNDECTGPLTLTVGNSFSTSTIVATNEGASSSAQPTSCGSNFDVWFKAVVPASGKLTIETAFQAGSLFTDSKLSVFSGACGNLISIECNDDGGNNNFSKIDLINRIPGEELLIAVSNFSNSSTERGPFQIATYDTTLLNNDSFDAMEFSFYPNPAKNILNLKYSETIASIEIFNILGQQVLFKNNDTNNAQVDISNLSSGQYVVRLTSGSLVKTIKIIKE